MKTYIYIIYIYDSCTQWGGDIMSMSVVAWSKRVDAQTGWVSRRIRWKILAQTYRFFSYCIINAFISTRYSQLGVRLVSFSVRTQHFEHFNNRESTRTIRSDNHVPLLFIQIKHTLDDISYDHLEEITLMFNISINIDLLFIIQIIPQRIWA